MAIEDLKQHGVLLPEEEWGTHSLHTTASEIPLLLLFLCGTAGCVLTYYGNGNLWTWIGIGIFFVTFCLIILLCDRAIQQQRKRMKQKKNNTQEPD